MSNSNVGTSVNASFPFCSILTLIFITLKLLGKIDWDWVWVLCPIWIPLVIVLLILAVGVSIVGIVSAFNRKRF